MTGRGLYIHIPFCKQKCNYCDFNSGPFRPQDLDSYVMQLKTEAQLYEAKYGRLSIRTVFIGGGTPSVLEPVHIYQLGELIHKHFDLTACVEFTFEANPESVTVEKAEAFKSIGANRVSIGLQTANDDELFAISRIHDWQTFLTAFRTMRQVGFDNINVDLMIGLPGQTPKTYMDSLAKVVQLMPEHLSTYGLILEEGTPLEKLVSRGHVQVMDGDSERNLYHESKAFLEALGYELYEISNFSKAGLSCKHNENYWLGGEYVALGVGAHGYLEGLRYENSETRADYGQRLEMGQLPIIASEKIDLLEQEREYMLLALRMTAGVNRKHYINHFGSDPFALYDSVLAQYQAEGLVSQSEDAFFLTEKGMDISNTVIIGFLEVLDKRDAIH